MKKSIALVALAFGVTNAFAQDLTSKKGEPYLPEAGDWAIAVDATPFLNYLGNFFGKTTNNTAPTWNFLNSNQTITGKYFVDAQTAYRASVRIGLNSSSNRNLVANRMNSAPSATANGFSTALPLVENKEKNSNTFIGLAAGIEKRKGKTRLQGYYGGEVGFSANMSKDRYTYGNALAVNVVSSGFNSPQSVDVTSADDMGSGNVVLANTIFQGGKGNARITERKNGTVFTFGVRGFIGAEYFLLPKMSIGGEFGWGLGLSTTGGNSVSYEAVGNTGAVLNNTSDVVGSTTIEGAKQGGFSLDTDGNNSLFGPSGSLRLNFHF